MKKLFYICFLLASSVSLYAAEKISSVSFNPSRMGEYTYLKVADKATLRGGLRTPQMNVSVGGTVSVYPDRSSRIYVLNQVLGQPTSAIDMQQAAFHGNSANTYTGYQSETTSIPSGLLSEMEIYGGNQLYLNDSYIQTLDAVNMLRQHAGTLKSDELSVLGSNGGTMSLYNGDDTYGFYLAGNDIPQPTASHTNTGKTLSNCTLAWEKRKTSDSPSQEVWLLALKDCDGAGSPPTPDPDPDTEPSGPKWVYSSMKVARMFLCNDEGMESAVELCKSYPSSVPEQCPIVGRTLEAMCAVSDYCPGNGIAAEVSVYVCQ